jgi:hypothetical protein
MVTIEKNVFFLRFYFWENGFWTFLKMSIFQFPKIRFEKKIKKLKIKNNNT